MGQPLTERMLQLMSKKDRAPMGKAGLTAAEAQAVQDERTEKELQRDMANLLEQRQIFALHSRMDKKTTLPKGTPDFLIFLRNGRYLAVEAKVKGGVISAEQVEMFHKFLLRTGELVHVVYSIADFVKVLEEHE